MRPPIKILLFAVVLITATLTFATLTLAAEITEGLRIEPSRILNQGGASVGLATYGLSFDPFSLEHQESMADLSLARQSIAKEATEGLFLGPETDSSLSARLSQEIVFTTERTHLASGEDSLISEWHITAVAIFAILILCLLSYFVTLRIKKRLRGS